MAVGVQGVRKPSTLPGILDSIHLASLPIPFCPHICPMCQPSWSLCSSLFSPELPHLCPGCHWECVSFNHPIWYTFKVPSPCTFSESRMVVNHLCHHTRAGYLPGVLCAPRPALLFWEHLRLYLAADEAMCEPVLEHHRSQHYPQKSLKHSLRAYAGGKDLTSVTKPTTHLTLCVCLNYWQPILTPFWSFIKGNVSNSYSATNSCGRQTLSQS